MELKRGCDSKRTLYYLTKAVQLNDYDESALVVRSRQQFSICQTLMSLDTFIRCYFTLGRNDEAVLDAEEAARINPDNSAAKEALATALYANGHFEQALIQFHRVYRFTCSFILFDDNLFCSE